MEIKDFSFELPENLIAQYPSDKRSNDRLLVIYKETGEVEDKMFFDIISYFKKGDVLVLNDTKVRKARVFATTENGGKVECLFLSEIDTSECVWSVIVSRSKRRKVGEVLFFADGYEAVITQDKGDGVKELKFNKVLTEDFFTKNGHVPLPPYIKREDEFSDSTRYQTIYSKNIGSCASPTSGLHWSEALLEKVKELGVEIVYITLHVGMGTFLPFRSRTLEEHKMHSEEIEVTNECADVINRAKKEKRRIIANGTTVVRTLESVFDKEKGIVVPQKGSTDIFIYPGFTFKVVDALITNFHTPESTLFALVCAFSSMDICKKAYSHAVDKKYRFFSYGDATLFL